MQNTNRFDTIGPENLKTPEAFRGWLKEKMSHLYLDKKIPNEHMLIYLDYIESVISSAGNVDKSFWMKLMRQLKSNLETLKRVE